MHNKQSSKGKPTDEDYKLTVRKIWASRVKIFKAQGRICTTMKTSCDPEHIDLYYPTPAVEPPDDALLNETEQMSREVQSAIVEVANYEVSVAFSVAPITLAVSVTHFVCRNTRPDSSVPTRLQACRLDHATGLEQDRRPRLLK